MTLIKRFVFILFFCFSVNYAHSQNYFGINTGLSVPLGDLKIDKVTGFHFGLNSMVSSGLPLISINAGLNYVIIRGEDNDLGITIRRSDPIRILNMYVGPQIGKENGFYFLPSFSGSYYNEKFQYGLNLGVGELYPLKKGKNKLDLGIKYSLLNLFSKTDADRTENLILVFLGLTF